MHALIAGVIAVLALPAGTAQKADSSKTAAPDTTLSAEAALEAQLTYQQGEIILHNGLARLRLTDDFRYLDPAQTERVLVEGWEFPAGRKTLGMLVPAGTSPISAEGWGVVISWDASGHVDDADAADIDFSWLLTEMQAATAEQGVARREQGFEPFHLVGWAVPPAYDSTTRSLQWGTEGRFGDSGEHMVSYNVRVLGRRGVLVFDAIAWMGELPAVKARMQEIPAMVRFEPGHRYADFDPETDAVADAGIGTLVAGDLAIQAGWLAVLLGGIAVFVKKFIYLGAKKVVALVMLAGKKALIVVGLAGLALAKRVIGRRTATA